MTPKKPAAKTTGNKETKKKDTAQTEAAAPEQAVNRTYQLKRMLNEKKAEILKEFSKYMQTREMPDSGTVLDDGDMSVIDVDKDINLRQLSAHRETLIKIDDAIRKINENTYGICDECGEEISPERLRVMPFAVYCRDCKERKEQMAEMEESEEVILP